MHAFSHAWPALVAWAVLCAVAPRTSRSAEPPEFTLETIRGKAVFLAEALDRKWGVRVVEEARDRVLAIETERGELVPVVEDIRGRAFRADERLRKVTIEVLVRRYRGSPVVQVVRLFEVRTDGLYEIDYWCVVCSIAMFELKPCECCQAETELRHTKIDPSKIKLPPTSSPATKPQLPSPPAAPSR